MTEKLFSAVAKPAVSFGLSKLFGSKTKSSPFDLVGIRTDAFDFDTRAVKGGINPLLERRRTLFEGLSPEQKGIFGRLRELEEDVRPGFGRFSEAAARVIRNARDRGIGNLRAQLRQKRVEGASFAEDLITRTELAFAEEEEAAVTRATLQEFAVSLQILDQENALLASQLNADLSELGIAAGVSVNLVNIAQKAQTAQAALAADNDLAQGEAFGISGKAIGGALGGILFPDEVEGSQNQTDLLGSSAIRGGFRTTLFNAQNFDELGI